MTTFELWYCQQLCFRCSLLNSKEILWLLLCSLVFLKSIYFFGTWLSYFYTSIYIFKYVAKTHDCSSLGSRLLWPFNEVIMTGNSSLNRRKYSRKRLLNGYIQLYLINFCSLYIYKMDLFILLLIIMFICCLMAEVRVEARGLGITVPGVIMKW